MRFYDLKKEDRIKLVGHISSDILLDIKKDRQTRALVYFSDEDTYIRKSAYLAIGRIYKRNTDLQEKILSILNDLFTNKNFKVRQTTVNAAGEIGIHQFEVVVHFFDKGLFDEHHSVRNAVIGSIKKMGEKNPLPVLHWAQKYLHHPNKEIRREICHGIELRGRTHPQDILPMLKELQNDTTARVRNTLVHVLGQVAYKKGCLETVVNNLKTWDNKEVVTKAIAEIIDVHDRYKNFAVLTQEQAKKYIKAHIES